MSSPSAAAQSEPAVVIISVQDYPNRRSAACWLEKAWSGAKQRGLEKLTSADQRKADL